ncbi:glycosyltransferase family 2 protein [Roseibium sp.]|uniref:glycosyltransferase family 2 protein n=1 Tax=Roseibium sp. TaxID=1936156 RepID=UPI003B507587
MDTFRVAIGIATAGRPNILSDTLDFITELTGNTCEILICPASETDIDYNRLQSLNGCVRIVRGTRGLPAQRNALFDACDADVLVFFDDDFLPAANFVEQVVNLFQENQDVVAATGHVIADGILTEGLSFEDGRRLLSAAGNEANSDKIVETYGAYGCNMIIRMATVRDHGLRFDEKLPLYAWLEDLDFSRRIAVFGRIVKSYHLRGVHLGTKQSGRSPGHRLGYSQVANPIYLARKGSIEWRRALKHVCRNFVANSVRSVRPEPWVDRQGRLRGNLIAIKDTFLGKLHPQRILELD